METKEINKYKVLVFAGTTEGYAISRFLSERGVSVCAFAATDYGSRSLEENEYLKVKAGRLDDKEMEELFAKSSAEFVLDATHPYAALVTENIRKACEKTGMRYLRILREAGEYQSSAVYVESTAAAAEYLAGTTGNVLLTTGSKELSAFMDIPNAKERLYARVLSIPSVAAACSSLGIEGRHLICMQGPFSKEMNVAMLRQYDCRYLVTKDTGAAGGFAEKTEAALECGAVPVIIGRPLKEDGMSLKQCKKMLADHFGLRGKQKVTLLGIGMGGRGTLTVDGLAAVEEAELIIGAKRMTDAVQKEGQDIFCEYRSEEIARYIEEHPEYEKIVIALSGDVGFYSGAKKLLDRLGEDTQVLCGISSVVYFMAKLGLSWDDAKLVSAHGRGCNLVSHIVRNEKVFAILGTRDGVRTLARKLVEFGMGEVLLGVGENLSYENEKIFMKPALELTDYEGDALGVVCAVNKAAAASPATHGLPDDAFLRGKAPMTKEEIRMISLGKLRLQEDSICYDVGAGTGSVSVEMALRAHQGRVYAIEKKEEAAALLRENRIRFCTENMEVIEGLAPEALADLEAPTHVFIGGSSGNLKEIVGLVLKKNRQARIVINCITLETVAEAMETIREFDFETREIVQVGCAKSKEIGRYHMMMGENPIYIITLQKGETA